MDKLKENFEQYFCKPVNEKGRCNKLYTILHRLQVNEAIIMTCNEKQIASIRTLISRYKKAQGGRYRTKRRYEGTRLVGLVIGRFE